ncbi:rhomboid family intramembrane serine protease [Gordonia sp. zg691]|uniref:Rhomboid family intramembrane serine protease n=1 Tax=Gordonia jinghuaiqii TaxID=2758710 RepID=A0A7D7LWF1_9ACTN|nr:rhomboid family intramembrane serine protease [Gordonia jinghuaiqii]MBD0864026.1 rhomboid family intramembrane serine protease [Gordonia jinghuaiqii]MCR5980536.1 rhomboid family intramembrane serine protease [Gordonia jinghuaiqii]QMT03301.1 rhomboid family intramembrane serine protease [Gordonia jinghuaiqii]
MTSYTTPIGQEPARRSRPLWLRSLIITVGIVAALFVIELIDAATRYDLDQNGIVARDVDGLDGILWAPMLHADWQHLIANLMPGAVLCFLVLMTRRFLIVTAIVWLVSGAGVWLFAAPYSPTVGASGIIFGWLTFLIVRGLFNRDLWQILGGVVLFLIYGSILWGVLPSDPLVSWQAHLFGAIAGVLAAWLLAARDRRTKRDVATPGVSS